MSITVFPRTAAQLQRIAALGGMVGVGMEAVTAAQFQESYSVNGLRRVTTALAAVQTQRCGYSKPPMISVQYAMWPTGVKWFVATSNS